MIEVSFYHFHRLVVRSFTVSVYKIIVPRTDGMLRAREVTYILNVNTPVISPSKDNRKNMYLKTSQELILYHTTHTPTIKPASVSRRESVLPFIFNWWQCCWRASNV